MKKILLFEGAGMNFCEEGLNRFGEYLRYSSEVKELKDKTIFYR
ncbi:hypothetical protein [Metaclostridioides mangenotii]|nr:hypothetical protein [Clostridioides mangenotii]